MIINEKSKNKKLTNNILSLAEEAMKAKQKNPEAINSTAGMLFDENNKLYTFETVKKAMSNLSDESLFKYSDTGGTPKFQKAIIEWVFGEEIKSFSSHHIKVFATPGGSGAIALTFSTKDNPFKRPFDGIMLEPILLSIKSRRYGDLMAYPTFWASGIPALTTPIRSPLLLNNGPPLLPG